MFDYSRDVSGQSCTTSSSVATVSPRVYEEKRQVIKRIRLQARVQEKLWREMAATTVESYRAIAAMKFRESSDTNSQVSSYFINVLMKSKYNRCKSGSSHYDEESSNNETSSLHAVILMIRRPRGLRALQIEYRGLQIARVGIINRASRSYRDSPVARLAAISPARRGRV
ncbi:hypothetical protein K0M31_003818 [Melipona bicolor]|uniref:Uncharacterized protein n=1 Tax=Melipona bicolor TaxID=60889 RepID=A0AA40KNU6_9HYME|nr:hypothetical protein K0M31_003818 [Melipona bicolor]